MAENTTNIYYGSGIGVAGNIDIGAIGLPADSRVMVKKLAGLAELQAAKRVYDGMIVYCEETHTYHKCRVDWDSAFNIVSCSWTEVVIKSEDEIKTLIASETTAAMEFKGTAASLPENPSKGDFYKVAGENISIKIDDVDAKSGDSIVYNGEQWFLIPSGDDIEDTWRQITGVKGDATLTFSAGSKLEVVVNEDGTITYSHLAIEAPVNTNADGDQKVREYITAIETDGYGHITGYKTNIEDVVDTTYEFEGVPVGDDDVAPSNVHFSVTPSHTEVAEVVYLDAYTRNEADNKFVAIDGDKQLSDNNFTDELLEKLNDIAAGAQVNVIESVKVNGEALIITDKSVNISIPDSTKVEDSAINGNIKVDGDEVTVYEHPDKHSVDEIDQFAEEVAKVKVAGATHADAAGKVDNALTVKVGGEDVVYDGSETKTADIDAAISAAVTAALTWGEF